MTSHTGLSSLNCFIVLKKFLTLPSPRSSSVFLSKLFMNFFCSCCRTFLQIFLSAMKSSRLTLVPRLGYLSLAPCYFSITLRQLSLYQLFLTFFNAPTLSSAVFETMFLIVFQSMSIFLLLAFVISVNCFYIAFPNLFIIQSFNVYLCSLLSASIHLLWGQFKFSNYKEMVGVIVCFSVASDIKNAASIHILYYYVVNLVSCPSV